MAEEAQLDTSESAMVESIAMEFVKPAPVRDDATGQFAKPDTPATESEAPEAQETAPAEQPASEDVVEEAEPETAIDAPQSWTAEAKAHFEKLPPELKAYVHERESERERGINAKLSEAAQARKAADEAAQTAAQERQQYAETLKVIAQYAQAMDPIIAEGQKTDWPQLAKDDPAGYVEKWAAYQQRVQILQAIQAEAGQVSERQRRDAITEQHKLLAEAIPDFADAEKAKAKRDGYLPTLVAAGYTPAEIDQYWVTPFDHRQVKVLDKASAYDRLMAAQKTVAQKKASPPPTKVVKPRASDTTPSESSRIAALRAKADKTGSDRDLAAFLTASLLEGRPQ